MVPLLRLPWLGNPLVWGGKGNILPQELGLGMSLLLCFHSLLFSNGAHISHSLPTFETLDTEGKQLSLVE